MGRRLRLAAFPVGLVVIIAAVILTIRTQRQLIVLKAEVLRLEQRQARLAESAPLAKTADVATLDSVSAPGIAIQASTGRSAQPELDMALEKWFERVNQLKGFIAQKPEWNVPELAVVMNEDWLYAVYGNQLETEKDVLRAYSFLVGGAQTKINAAIVKALNLYRETYLTVATDVQQLKPFLPAYFDDRILSRIEITATGSARTRARTNP